MPEKILFIRFSAIGDCAMAAWTATSIRYRIPDAEFTWVVDSRCAAVVDSEKLTNEVANFPRDRWKKKRWSVNTWKEQLGFYSNLRRQNFDWGVDFQGHSKTAICLKLANPKKRLMARATDSFARKLNLVQPGNPKSLHTVEWNQKVIQNFGDFELPNLPIMPLNASQVNIPMGSVGIATGAGFDDKTWSPDRWKTAAEQLIEKGIPVVLFGSGKDPNIPVAGGLNLVNKLELWETISCIRKCAAIFAGDTGIGHIAAGYGIPTVSLFGPTDPDVFRPFGEKAVVLKRGGLTDDVSLEEGVEAVLKVIESLKVNS